MFLMYILEIEEEEEGNQFTFFGKTRITKIYWIYFDD